MKWPGLAAVVVSVVHLRKGDTSPPYRLDGIERSLITAFLFHQGSHDNPEKLKSNSGLSYSGVKHYGDGFLFEDGKAKATAVGHIEKLLRDNPGCRDAIFPFIGGSEVNSHPQHQFHRYIINFGTRDEATVRERWPDLIQIVEEKVKPERMSKAADVACWPWWHFWRPRQELYGAIGRKARVIVNSQVSARGGFAFLPAAWVYAHSLNVFPLDTNAAFCALQSRPHELWARFFGSSLEDRLRYTPSDCFETFPFTENWQTDPLLEAAGNTYYEFRAHLMVRNNEGLTKTYNRFHDPNNHEPDIAKLRELHAAMDRPVLAAYGWDDIPTDCEFLLDYEIDEETWGTKKKPTRYRWPEAVHDEVLARLLDLNQKRYAEEVAAGLHAEKGRKGATPKKTRRNSATASNAAHPLFGSAMKPSEEV